MAVSLEIIGECKWTNRKMPRKVLDDLLDHKLPALRDHSGLSITKPPQIVLFSRAGFDRALEEVQSDDKIHLVDLPELERVLTLG